MFRKKMMKKAAVLAVMVMSIALAGGCGSKENTEKETTVSETTVSETTQGTQETFGNVQIPNPWIDLETVEEAEKIAGFSLEVPEIPEEYEKWAIRVLKSDDQPVFEEIWRKKDEKEIRIRKAPGTEDISGDYIVYAQENTVTVDDSEVTMKGAEDKIQLATWTNGGYTYSIYVEVGISAEEMTEFVENVR